MIVIQTIHIVLTIVALVGLAGWIMSYLEYRKRKAGEELYETKLKEQESKYLDHLSKSMESSDRKLQKVREEYDRKVQELEETLNLARDLRETELEEAEELVKAKIKEIEAVYKEVIDDQNSSLELYESYIKNFDAVIQAVDARLQTLDDKGVFAGDDEVGFFFSYVKNLQETLGRFKVKKEELDEEQSKTDIK